MFYSHDILQKRGGKFGIIWIAATKGVSLTKRDYCSVCVPKSCDDIVKYITLQAQPSGRKGSRPRFSLYLQSQLMVGVARVFEKQFSYFIVDVHELHKRTSRLTPASFEDIGTANLQLKKNPRSAELCTLPESRLYHDDEFGMMRGSFETSPDPLLLPEIELFSVSPYRAAKLSTSLLQLSPSQMDKLILESPPHVVSSASEINLKEEEEARSTDEIEIPGIELPPLDGLQDLLTVMGPDMTEAQPPQVEEEDKELNLSQITDFGLDQLWELDDQTGQLMLSPPSKGAFPGLQGLRSPSLVAATPPVPDPQTEGAVIDEEEEVEPQQMEEKPPKKKRDKRDRGLVTPATGPVMQEILRLSPIDAASSPSPLRRRGRKRRLVFADSTTQLSKKDIRHNMATVSNLIRKETIIPLKYLSAKELFDEPARKALKVNPNLLKLWRGRAQLRIAITDPEAEDLDAPAWSIADTRPRPPLPSSTDTTSRDEEEEEDDDERARLVKEIPEVLRRDISVSPELLRDVSLETSHPRAKFEDTPQSIIMSDASHLSESKDSSHRKSFHSDTSSHRGSHRPIVDSFKEMEEAIPEELMDMQELPLLPEEDIALELMEGPAVPETEALEGPEGPEAISTSEDEAGKKKKTEKKPIPHDNVLRGIGELTAQSDTILFKDLVPANTFRPIAVKIFSICLEYAAMKLIRVSQKKPYGDITIRRGPAFA